LKKGSRCGKKVKFDQFGRIINLSDGFEVKDSSKSINNKISLEKNLKHK